MVVQLIPEDLAQVISAAYCSGQTPIKRRPISARTGLQISHRSTGSTGGRQGDNQGEK